ncbi:MAG: alpha/beta hydrolase [Bradymonadaceae bacterium]
MIYRIRKKFGSPRLWRHLAGPIEPAEKYVVPTADGLSLALWRIRPGGGVRRKAPVMLQHGLASNHLSFHLPGRSLAGWLAERGHDVWLPELRGHGSSLAHGYDWRIDDYLEFDLPAIVGAILGHSEAEELQWVGHSMGGILLMCYGILHRDAPIQRGMTLGSALDYKVGHTGFSHLLKLRPIIERLVAIPYGTLVHLIAPAMGRGAIRALEGFNAWPSNIDPAMARALHARCFHTIPTSLLSSLATTFEPEGLCLKSGFRFMEAASDFPFPMQLIAGSRDAQVAVDAVLHTAELLGENARVLVHGLDNGDADEYGHWDLILGCRAPQEVWPGIARWLEAEE